MRPKNKDLSGTHCKLLSMAQKSPHCWDLSHLWQSLQSNPTPPVIVLWGAQDSHTAMQVPQTV